MSNHSIMIFLVNKNVRAVMVSYEGESDPPTAAEIAKRTMFKTLDHSLKVGDLVIIPTGTRLKFTAAKIVVVDVEVDLEHAGEVRWIAGPVDVAAYEQVLGMEKSMLDQIKAAEVAHRRKELADKLMANVDQSAIRNLAIANMTDMPDADLRSIEPPSAPSET